MKFKNLIVIFLVFFLFNLSVFSSYNYNDFLEKSKEVSLYYQNLLHNVKSADLSFEILKYNREHKVSFGLDENTIYYKKDNALTGESDNAVSISPFFSYSSNNKNTTSFKVSSPINIITGKPDENTYSPSVSFNQLILLNGVDDNQNKLARRKSLLEFTALKRKIDSQFEADVLDVLSDVLSSENDFKKSEIEYLLKLNEFEALKSSQSIQEGTYSYNIKLNEVRLLQESVEIKRIALQNSTVEFQRVTGLDVTDLDTLFDIDTEIILEELPEGNTYVKSALIDVEIAQNAYDILVKNDDRALNIDFRTSTDVKGSSVKNWGLSGGVSYIDNKISATVSSGSNFSSLNDFEPRPYVNLGFTYSVGTHTDDKKRTQKEKALIELQNKQFIYNNRVIEYKNDVSSTKRLITSNKIALQRAIQAKENAELDYQKAIKLNENGYYTSLQFKNEVVKYNAAINTYNIALIKSRLLALQIDILNS